MIAAGTLRDRITLQRRATAQDGLGQPVDAWAIVATVWGNIRYPSGMSSIKSSADVSTVRVSIRIRYRADLDAGLRVVSGGRIFNVQAVLPNRAEGYVDLVCERVE